MALAYSSLAGSKTRKVVTLTSGTSWTVPSGVTSVNVKLAGGGGGSGAGGGSAGDPTGVQGVGGSVIESTVSTTPGASISYSIGAGGAGSNGYLGGSAGGDTTFTGATTAPGGGSISNATAGFSAGNGARGGNLTTGTGQTGGNGSIVIEYWT